MHSNRLMLGEFESFKSAYYSCQDFMSHHVGQIISRHDVCKLACQAYTKSMPPSNIISFRKTGVYPLNRDVVTEKMLAPSIATNPQTESTPSNEPVPAVTANTVFLSSKKANLQTAVQATPDSQTSNLLWQGDHRGNTSRRDNCITDCIDHCNEDDENRFRKESKRHKGKGNGQSKIQNYGPRGRYSGR